MKVSPEIDKRRGRRKGRWGGRWRRRRNTRHYGRRRRRRRATGSGTSGCGSPRGSRRGRSSAGCGCWSRWGTRVLPTVRARRGTKQVRVLRSGGSSRRCGRRAGPMTATSPGSLSRPGPARAPAECAARGGAPRAADTALVKTRTGQSGRGSWRARRAGLTRRRGSRAGCRATGGRACRRRTRLRRPPSPPARRKALGAELILLPKIPLAATAGAVRGGAAASPGVVPRAPRRGRRGRPRVRRGRPPAGPRGAADPMVVDPREGGRRCAAAPGQLVW